MGCSWFFFTCSVCIPNLLNEAYAEPSGVDRDVLLAFKAGFNQSPEYNNDGFCLETWGGTDYCIWYGVTCEEDDRVSKIDRPGCNLLGFLTPELGKLEMLTQLNLYTNALQGSIPMELGNLTNLFSLTLYDNFLEGYIPKELGKLTNLKYLELQDNNLNGTVPDELAKNFPTMIKVNLTNNKGPVGVGNLTGPCTEKACPNPESCRTDGN